MNFRQDAKSMGRATEIVFDKPCPVFRAPRRDKSITEHTQFLDECWPEMSTEQIWTMLKIQRQDEEIPYETVAKLIGERKSHEELHNSKHHNSSSADDRYHKARQHWRQHAKDKHGVTGVTYLTIRRTWKANWKYKSSNLTEYFTTMKRACDWYDRHERRNVPEEYQVLNDKKRRTGNGSAECDG